LAILHASRPFWPTDGKRDKRMADVREIGPPLIGKNWAEPRPSTSAIMRKF